MHKFLFYNKFIIFLYMFRALCAHHQEVKIVLYSIFYHHTLYVAGRCTEDERTDRQTDRHGEAKSRFSQICERTYSAHNRTTLLLVGSNDGLLSHKTHYFFIC